MKFIKKGSVRKAEKKAYKNVDFKRYNELIDKLNSAVATIEEAEELKEMINKLYNTGTHQKCTLYKKNEMIDKINTYINLLKTFLLEEK